MVSFLLDDDDDEMVKMVEIVGEMVSIKINTSQSNISFTKTHLTSSTIFHLISNFM